MGHVAQGLSAELRTEPLSIHEEILLRPITHTGPGFRLFMGLLSLIAGWAFFAWGYQLKHGLGVTGMFRPVYWGVYITNFVFFIGVSHAGTLISAILRLAQAEWRRSITRMAEVITVMVICFGAGNVLVDMGRPERALNVFLHPHFRSPLLWDVCSISVYLTGSLFYLFLPMLPDLVRIRDRIGGWRRTLYWQMSWFYDDTPAQRHKLERTIGVVAVIILPIAVSVHTVVSWVFAMTIQPMWHSTIFGPFFVVGAIFSGIAALLTYMVILRKVYHLEDYLRPIHFDYLGRLFLVMSMLWLYFTFAEYLTTWYGDEPVEMAVFWDKVIGNYAFPTWLMFTTCFIIPFSILCRKKTRTITGVFIASITVNIGMWLERYTIIVPTLTNARIHLTNAVYHPTWVEISIFMGCTAGFIMFYLGFTKLFPIVAIWEVEDGIAHGADATADRIRTYLPKDEDLPAPAPAGATS